MPFKCLSAEWRAPHGEESVGGVTTPEDGSPEGAAIVESSSEPLVESCVHTLVRLGTKPFKWAWYLGRYTPTSVYTCGFGAAAAGHQQVLQYYNSVMAVFDVKYVYKAAELSLYCWAVFVLVAVVCVVVRYVVLRAWEAGHKRWVAYRDRDVLPPEAAEVAFRNKLAILSLRLRPAVGQYVDELYPDVNFDPEIGVKCHYCRALFARWTNHAVAEAVFAFVDKKEWPAAVHMCPAENAFAPPLLLAKYIGLLVGLILRVRVEKAEGKAAKAKNRVDQKHYTRGGFKRLKPFLSDEDYSHLANLVEDGRLHEAEERLKELEEWEGREDRGERVRNDQQRADLRAFINRMGENMGSRAFYQARSSWQEGRPVAQAGGGAGELPLAKEECWDTKATEAELEKLVEENRQLESLHRETTQRLFSQGAKQAIPAPEGVVFDSPLPPEEPPAGGLPTGLGAAQHKAVVADLRAAGNIVLEGNVASSTVYCKDHIVAALKYVDGRVMQGYLRRGEGGSVWVITGRHRIVDDGTCVVVEDGCQEPLPEAVTLYRPGVPPTKTLIRERRGNGSDRVALRIDFDRADSVGPVRFAQAVLGGVVSARYYDKERALWMETQGQVVHVTEHIVAYNMTTLPGCCRMAVFDSYGRIVAGHYYSGITTPAGPNIPAGMSEDGSISKLWVADYTIPPLVPQGPSNLRGPFQRVEPFKVEPLRSDLDFKYGTPAWFVAKPSTDMVKKEVQKFFEPINEDFDQEALRVATTVVCTLEKEAAIPYYKPKYADFLAVVAAMDNERTNAGADDIGSTHHDYLLALGEGDVSLGIERAASKAHRLYQIICGDLPKVEADEAELFAMRVWCVQGKRDRYKLKKLEQGRSIQAPSFTLKVIHRVVFKESDDAWISRKFMFRAGYDMDEPVSDELHFLYANTLASLGLDESGFDRRMPRKFMEIYFRYYLAYMVPGVPPLWLRFLESVTVDSLLLFTDGEVQEKDRGNPSGYPNTLRLNCIVQLLAWAYALSLRLKQLGLPSDADAVKDVLTTDIFLEICGDDSRANCLTDKGLLLLDSAGNFQAWLQLFAERLPWVVKIEGSVVFELHPDGSFVKPWSQRLLRFPPIVSRNLFAVDGLLFSPLHNPNRCLGKLMSKSGQAPTESGRDLAAETELRLSSVVTLKLHVFWHYRREIFCPAVQFLIDNDLICREHFMVAVEGVSNQYRLAVSRMHRVGDFQ